MEMDVYENISLVTLEVELRKMTKNIRLPKCIQNAIIMDVTEVVDDTGKAPFSNMNLSVPVDKHYIVSEHATVGDIHAPVLR